MDSSPILRLTHRGLDLSSLAEAFAVHQRVQITGFLETQAAEDLAAHLRKRADWRLTLRAGDKVLTYEAAQLAQLNEAQLSAVVQAAAPRSHGQFAYAFNAIDVDSASPATTTKLHEFAEFIGSAPVLDAVRTITGIDDMAWADAMATRYLPGHFLTLHHDQKAGAERRVAYVLGLTEGWRADWGGLLMFHNDAGDIASALLPRMNTLTLFAVPQAHSVSLLAPFATRPRYSITGWFGA